MHIKFWVAGHSDTLVKNVLCYIPGKINHVTNNTHTETLHNAIHSMKWNYYYCCNYLLSLLRAINMRYYYYNNNLNDYNNNSNIWNFQGSFSVKGPNVMKKNNLGFKKTLPECFSSYLVIRNTYVPTCYLCG